MKIRNKIFLGFLFAIIPMLLIVATFYFPARNNAIINSEVVMKLSLEKACNEFNDFFLQQKNTFSFITKLDVFGLAIEFNTLNEMNDYFKSLLETYYSFNVFLLADIKGNILISNTNQQSDSENNFLINKNVNSIFKINFNDFPTERNIFLADLNILKKENFNLTYDKSLLFVFKTKNSAQIHNGYFLALLDWSIVSKKINNLFKTIKETYNQYKNIKSTIIDLKNMVCLCPKFDISFNINDYLINWFKNNSPNKLLEFNNNNKKEYVIYQQLNIIDDQIESIKLNCVISIPEEDILTVVNDITKKVISISSISLILLIIIAFIISYYITDSILKLLYAIEDYNKGNKESKALIKSNDEIGKLALSFNELVQNLNKSTVSIEQLQEQIKERNITENKLIIANKNLMDNKEILNNMLQDIKKSHENLKLAQEQLIASEKMASIGQLSAGIAHEINNPTGFVISNLGLLSERINFLFATINSLNDFIDKNLLKGEEALSLKDKLKEIIDDKEINYLKEDFPLMIEESLEGMQRIKKIVANLKSFAHPGSDGFSLTNINEEIEKTLTLVMNDIKYNCTIIKEYQDLPLINTNSQQIQQVLINLIINASQAFVGKGIITIKTYKNNDFVIIEISDNGIGIPNEIINKIFDPFFTTKEIGKGTGLGLSIAYGIINEHKGTISVQSKVNEGTTFIIKLPIIAN